MTIGTDIKAVEGRDGWLFLANVGEIETLEGFRELAEWRRTLLPQFVATFVARARRMAARGIPFVIILAPEATGIYPDMLPDGVAIEMPTMAQHLAAALVDLGIDVICPAPRLRAARGPIDVYQKLDSHWSSFGAYLCYRELLAHLKGDRGVGWRDVYYSVSESFGDLGVHAVPERSGPVHNASIPSVEAEAGANVYDQRQFNVRRHTCASGTGRALVFRDSFASALTPYLERTFAETILVGGSPAMPDDAIDLFAPDLVIVEMAERSLIVAQAPFADWPPASFAQLHYERASSAVGGDLQVRSRAALERGCLPEAIGAAAVAVALEGADSPLHNLAHALLAAGQGDPALLQLGDQLCAAAAPLRGDRYLYWLQAQFAYRCGRETVAREAMAKALALQPDHAQYLYSVAIWDYLAGDYAAAIVTMRRSLELAPLHKESWQIAIACARLMGSPDLAVLMAQARQVLPDLDVLTGGS